MTNMLLEASLAGSYKCRRLDVRFTASWRTRNAFTDRHMAEGSEIKMPGLREKASLSAVYMAGHMSDSMQKLRTQQTLFLMQALGCEENCKLEHK